MLKKIILFLVFIGCCALINVYNVKAQRVGFVSSKMIREKLPDVKIAEQRVQTMVEEWNRELSSMDEKIEAMEFESKKNRLIWADNERATKEKELADLIKRRREYAKEKFEAGKEYDQIVNEVMLPVEEKIYAAIQQVASKEKYDIIWDQSKQPLAYVNFKYDITLKVLKTLGIDVEALEKEQDEKIKKDPRNKEPEQSKTQKTRRRSRTATKEDVKQEDAKQENVIIDIKQPEVNENKEENKILEEPQKK